MKKIVMTVFIVVMLAAVIAYAANDTFLGQVYLWIQGIVESQFGVGTP